MALKAVLTKEEWGALEPEAMKEIYIEKDGKYHLDAEPLADPALQKKIDEFRNTNINLLKEKEKLQIELDKKKDLDPEKVAELEKKVQELEDKKLIDEGNLDEVLQVRTERLRGDYEAQIKKLKETHQTHDTEVASLKTQLAVAIIDNQVRSAVAQYTKPKDGGCIVDIISRARSVFKMDENNKPIARNLQTGEALFSKDGSTPLSIDEWVQNLPEETPWFFETSHGSGAAGGGGDEGGQRRLPEGFEKMDTSEKLKYAHRLGDTGKGLGKK